MKCDMMNRYVSSKEGENVWHTWHCIVGIVLLILQM